jgi:glutaredoxin 3
MKIKLYASPSCDWSNKLKTWLRRRRIAFEYLDVMDDHKLWDQVLEKSNQLSTPVIDIDGEIIVGFQEDKIKKLIDEGKIRDKNKVETEDPEEE